MRTTYKLITSPPYDKGAPITYWIKKETKLFGFSWSSKLIGDYKYDNTYGELGDCPFFDRKSAQKRLKIYTKNE